VLAMRVPAVESSTVWWCMKKGLNSQCVTFPGWSKW